MYEFYPRFKMMRYSSESSLQSWEGGSRASGGPNKQRAGAPGHNVLWSVPKRNWIGRQSKDHCNRNLRSIASRWSESHQNQTNKRQACKSGGSIGQLYPISAVGITAIAVSSHPQVARGGNVHQGGRSRSMFFPMIHGTNPVAFLSHKAVAEGRSIEIQNMHLP